MFDIFIKKSRLTVDCFTCNPALYEYFPISNANKNYPDWWKNLNATFISESNSGIRHDIPTLKRCDALLGLYNRGFCMSMWSDLIIETNKQGEFRYQYSSDENAPLVSHSRQQLGPGFDDLIHVKIISPWLVEEKKGVQFLYTGASWNQIDRLFDWNIVPGIVDFKNQSSTHVNFFLPIKENRIEFSAGETIVHIIPLSDKKIEIKNHLISFEEWNKKHLRYSYMSSFTGRFKKNAKR